LAERRAIEPTPPVERGVEALRDGLDDLAQPLGDVAVGGDQRLDGLVKRRSRQIERALPGGVVPQRGLHLGEDPQAGSVPAHVEHVGERGPQVEADDSQPDRVDMRADEVLVGEVEACRGDGSAHHQARPLEEVLVVRAA